MITMLRQAKSGEIYAEKCSRNKYSFESYDSGMWKCVEGRKVWYCWFATQTLKVMSRIQTESKMIHYIQVKEGEVKKIDK